MRRVSLADLELASHDPVYQRRFEAIKEVSDMWPGWGNAMWTGLTRPIASVCHHKGALILPVRIAIHLMEDSPVSINEESFNVIVFTKERFHAGLRFPLLFLFKQFFHFTKIPSSFIHPNAVRILMGCSILNMLYHLDLSLLELVTEFPDSTKGATKGHVVISGTWAGSYEHPTHAFEPCRSLGISGKRMRGRLVEWVDKTSFNQLNKLFVISVVERDHETLLTDQNLLTLCRDSELYAVPTVPRFAPRVLVTDKHFVLKDLPFYEEARAADTKARQDRLDKREKKHQERTLRQAPGKHEPAVPYINLEPEGEEEEDMASRLKVGFKERHRKCLSEALPTTPLPAKKSHPKAPREELALEAPIVEDACPTEDGISTGIPCGNANEGNALDNPSSWKDIAALLKRVPYFTAPKPSTSGVHAFFPYFRRQIVKLPGGVFDVVCPSYGTREFVLQWVTAIHNLMRQQSLLLKWLEVAESMQVFLTQQIDNSEELCAQLVGVENELTTVWKAIADTEKLQKELKEEMQVANAEACRMGEENEAAKAKCKDAEQERDQLKKELEEL
ncbi:hypothetical protein CK203_003920 [Vitis vinifera]|uniref:Uncharacterized protein n=1 Tax=Vitis vinifera TaxID=29760 RepID=A0A438KAE9_VITVI|nr:hypothetical protein CK203_003920 [Vitis vinifera]